MKRFSLLLLLITLFLACAQPEKEEETPTKDEIAIISTDFGEIYVALYDETPLHKENFLKLAKEGFYDSTTFHRIIEGFMIQGGDPNSKDENPLNDGQGGPGYTIEAEFNRNFYHKKGALAAARIPDQQNPEKRSSGSQFYIVHGQKFPSIGLDRLLQDANQNARQQLLQEFVFKPENSMLLEKLRRLETAGKMDSLQVALAEIEPLATQGFIPRTYSQEQRQVYSTLGGYPPLDGNYTVFGEVIRGLAIVDSIAVQEKGAADRPVTNIMMTIRVEEMEREQITTEFGYSYN